MFGDVAQSLGVRLEPRIDEAVVEGNRHHLRQVVNNLLDNALRHTPIGGRVTVQSQPRGERVRIAVTDSGPGLTREEAERDRARAEAQDNAADTAIWWAGCPS